MNARPRLTDHLNLIRNIRTTGTIAPSSKGMIDRLLGPADFLASQCVVELGPGNGCITRSLLQRMSRDSTLLCFELNSDFVASLNSLNEPRLKVYNACASSIGVVLDELGVDKVDHVVSSLPLAIMGSEVVKSTLDSVSANLRPGGYFLQYQYTMRNFADIKRVFPDARIRFTMRNMPPAFIYQCTKGESHVFANK